MTAIFSNCLIFTCRPQDYDQTLHYYHQAYKIKQKKLSIKHQDLPLDLNSIVNFYLKKGEDDIILTFSKQNLDEKKKTKIN